MILTLNRSLVSGINLCRVSRSVAVGVGAATSSYPPCHLIIAFKLLALPAMFYEYKGQN